MHIIIIRTDMY